ncbi:Flp family type IVb pilin [Streptomyces purpureus]|uniref:Flp family type IVb pilin n=1 Tax=Streptomyces purpureus TaxID=1951 RepID=UPI0003A19C59|nr:Flp family type IVb pilin [Streptomyces purpureus]
MSDVMLKSATTAKVYVGHWTNTAVDRVKARYEAKDRGQTAVEYLGIIVVVVAIVVAITGTDIGQSIKTAITTKIGELTGGAKK